MGIWNTCGAPTEASIMPARHAAEELFSGRRKMCLYVITGIVFTQAGPVKIYGEVFGRSVFRRQGTGSRAQSAERGGSDAGSRIYNCFCVFVFDGMV